MPNREGIDWQEWACAAGVALYDRYGFVWLAVRYDPVHRRAWTHGVDPTEFRNNFNTH